MKRENWYWDLGMPFEKIREILTDEQNPKFPRIAARLLARVDDPEQVFSLITPLAFCRRFIAIQQEVNKDEWTKEKGAFWRATYERYSREFQRSGVRLRQRQPREPDPFIDELAGKLRECRETLHFSQGQVAEMLGCSQQFISGIEQGREKITIDYLRRFANKTGSDFDLILRSPRQAHTEETKASENYTELKDWVEQERRAALEVAKAQQLDKCLMEVVAYIPNKVVNARSDAWGELAKEIPDSTLKFQQQRLQEAMKQTQAISPVELRQAMEQSEVHSFGWPIGLVMTRPEYAPKPYRDGIRATILTTGLTDRSSFDYWALRTDGVFYLLKTLFEDERSEGKIFIDTRVVRTAETLLRLSRLYRALHVTPEEQMVVRIRYTGLRSRVLSFADSARVMRHDRVCVENETETWVKERLKDIEPKLVHLVHAVVSELCILFDYFPLSKEQVVQPLVEKFLRENPERPTT